MQRLFLPLLFLLALGLASCEDEVSNIGAPYFSDTIGVRTDSVVIDGSSRGISLANYSLPAIPTNQLTYNATAASGTLFLGKAENGALEAWPVLRFPVLQTDTLDRVKSVTLQVKVVPYMHGARVISTDFAVYVEGAGKINEATTSLTTGDLSANSFGVHSADLPDSSGWVVNITLDSAIRTQLRAASTSLVIVPGTMTNVRAFGSTDLTDAKFHPQLEFTYTDGSEEKKTYRKPNLDMTIVKRTNTHAADQLFIAGGSNDRVVINFLPDSMQIDRFSAINTAILRLKLDPAHSSIGLNARDTLGPAVVFKNLQPQADTGAAFISLGVKSSVAPDTWDFEIRDVIELWLDDPSTNFGFELRAGYATRTIGGNLIITEDYTLNRWAFFGPSSAPADRPQLIITSSSLK